jgi:hypothetical protein
LIRLTESGFMSFIPGLIFSLTSFWNLPISIQCIVIPFYGRLPDEVASVTGIIGSSCNGRLLQNSTWADTTTAHGRLMLTVLGGLAEFERDLIRTRTGEGRERADARGVKLGRKPKLTEAQQDEARRRRAEGATLAEPARSYGVGKSTISRLTA